MTEGTLVHRKTKTNTSEEGTGRKLAFTLLLFQQKL
jgi:hypothetical protein